MIEIKNLNKTYDNKNKALKNINIHIEQGEFVFIMGRSGSGKSTLMKILLKEVEPTSGQVIVNDMELGKMPRRYVPKYRKMLGVVFQDFRLLKHMTVYENVAFAQRVLGLPVRKIKENVPAMLRQVGLSSKYKSYPDQLSGGEQQRVALCRCIVTKPKVLLMDEPFSAIDAKRRKAIQKRSKEIHRERGMTTICVTHDQDEAMSMSDTIHLMNRGIVEQSARPLELYAHPKTAFAASFMGNYNMMTAEQFRSVTGDQWRQDVCIRPELIEIFGDSVEDLEQRKEGYTLSGTVTERIPQGNTVLYYVTVSNLQFKVSRLFNSPAFFEEGQKVCLFIPRDAVLQYEKET